MISGLRRVVGHLKTFLVVFVTTPKISKQFAQVLRKSGCVFSIFGLIFGKKSVKIPFKP